MEGIDSLWRREGAWAQMHLPCQVHELHHASPQLTSAITSTSTRLSTPQDGTLAVIHKAYYLILIYPKSAQNSAGIQTLLDVRTTAHQDLRPTHTVPRPSEMHRRLSSKVFQSPNTYSPLHTNHPPARECTHPRNPPTKPPI